MLRQVSSRNQRGKGSHKMKTVLHMCLLIAICIWLLCRMNHSHDKKETFEERREKGDERWFNIRRFGREDLPHIAEVVDRDEDKGVDEAKKDSIAVGHGIRQEEVMDEGGSDVELEDEEEAGLEEEKEDQSKEWDGIDDHEHNEAVHKAREISFKGDDVSSEVVHTIQEVDHKEASQAAQERSFKADDASSAVAHVVQVNEFEPEFENDVMKNLDRNKSDDKKRKEGETGDMPEGNQRYESKNEAVEKLGEIDPHGKDNKEEAQHVLKEKLDSESEHRAKKNIDKNESDVRKEENSSASMLLDNTRGNNSSINHQGSLTANNATFASRFETPILDKMSLQDMTVVESKNEGRQPDMRISSVVNNQTSKETQLSTDAGELLANSSYFLNHKIYFQKNSTTVSIELVESPVNLIMKPDPANSTVSENQTTIVHEEMNKTKMQSQGKEKPKLKTELTEQKIETVPVPLESKEPHNNSSSENGNGEVVQLETSSSLTSQANDQNFQTFETE
ncbi:peptidyl-prolyl cis-trans isomerase 1-like [Zingiber officinale]|uniref:Uncharacterized protein n=1 Tax=Zingiber officinale TaxID=94328 RepID=A0A8J5I373_ZINOF|nr:peptidyl-prolyl cis-trans isomerase 1-like [Zingiber officinale]KAG6533076.1 hypothetical protein ZIOFF_006937 [Zingiber officinale]